MSWIRILVHLVFSTNGREPLLNSKETREIVINHILKNCSTKDIHILSIGGFSDHLHCLISLNKDQSISQVCQLIKGESSFWINHAKILPRKFTWQDDYWAASVSEGHAQSVIKYIKNQEEHHKRKGFNEEVSEFMQKYGWSFVDEKQQWG
jgi:putative transposase